MPRDELTLYQQHVQRWKGCTACHLHTTRKYVVLARGCIPCDVLMVGEAPGHSENILGSPFVGPAGKLLEQIVRNAIRMSHREDLTVGYTNLICCIPLGDDGQKVGDPPEESVEACKPRLQELVAIADPKLIVCVGKQPKEWMDPGYRHSIGFHKSILVEGIIHPAAILRMAQVQQGLVAQRTAVTLSNILEDV